MKPHSKWARQTVINDLDATLIAHWIDLGAYYELSDGTVWAVGCTGRPVNQGDKETFIERFKAGRYRGQLIESEDK